jgi:WD40 repeat protein
VAVPFDARGVSGVRLVDAGTGRTLRSLPMDQSIILRVQPSPDGARVAVLSQASTGPSVRMWDAATGRILFDEGVRGGELHTGLAFSPAGDRLAIVVHPVAPLGPEVRVLDAGSGAVLNVLDFKGSPPPSGDPVFAPDGRVVVCPCLSGAATTGTPEIWNLATGQRVARLAVEAGSATTWLASGDGRRLITGGSDGTVRVWDGSRYELLLTLTTDGAVTALSMSADGQRIAAGTSTGAVHVWTAATGAR